MQQKELLKAMREEFNKCLALAKKKNSDYARIEDALENFRDFGILGIAVRLNDKTKRLKNIILNRKIAVQDESVEDIFRDLVNFGLIGLVIREAQRRHNNER